MALYTITASVEVLPKIIIPVPAMILSGEVVVIIVVDVALRLWFSVADSIARLGSSARLNVVDPVEQVKSENTIYNEPLLLLPATDEEVEEANATELVIVVSTCINFVDVSVTTVFSIRNPRGSISRRSITLPKTWTATIATIIAVLVQTIFLKQYMRMR
ncbi:uncharacterized protein V1516DRAFT_677336 [Lipomyces oligophaga]|uniref:uncharacterized protein n=1 Tax=Lipomyces oligophaga TaxID=45792 RepID=UPI0034CEB6D8